MLMGTKDVSSPAVFRQGNMPAVVIMPMNVQWPSAILPQPAEPKPTQEGADSEETDEVTKQELDSLAEHEAGA